MEIQLGELIEQIKKDGVAEAQNEAAKIIEAANAESERIISEAKEKAKKLVEKATSECERTVRSSEDAIRQAGRNLLLSFRESVARELDSVLRENTDKANAASLDKLIVCAVEAWTKNTNTDDVTVLLNQKDIDALEATLLKAFKEKLISGVILTPSDSFDGGFRITANGESVYYDYSKDAVVDMLSAYLNPKVTALMKEAEAE